MFHQKDCHFANHEDQNQQHQGIGKELEFDLKIFLLHLNIQNNAINNVIENNAINNVTRNIDYTMHLRKF